jgi:hypothetical protein
MTQEHRINPRHRTLKGGKIAYAKDTCVVDCVIRNLSDTGASLVVPMTVGIPGRFTLVDAHGGTRHSAEVVWRRGDRIGVHFTDVADTEPQPHLPRAQRRLRPHREIHGAKAA